MTKRQDRGMTIDFANLETTLRQAPAAGGLQLSDPGPGTITKREAQRVFLAGMAIVMREWHDRGVIEGRLRERERVATILGSKAALRRRELAERLALTTDLSPTEAIVELDKAPRSVEGG